MHECLLRPRLGAPVSSISWSLFLKQKKIEHILLWCGLSTGPSSLIRVCACAMVPHARANAHRQLLSLPLSFARARALSLARSLRCRGERRRSTSSTWATPCVSSICLWVPIVDLPVCTHSQGCRVWALATPPSLPRAAHTPRLPGAGFAEACARGPNKKEKGKTLIRKNKNQNKKK